MRNTSLSRVRKIILLASVLVLMLALCGCRTRITNNDEVSNVMYDEEGYRQDEYNMRRDALGLGKAPKPVFTGFGAPENDEEYDYGSDSEMLEEYDPDEEGLDPYADTEDTSSDEASTTGGNSGGSQRRVIRRNSSSGSSKASEGVTVKLNPNGGTCKTKSVKIKTGDNYGELPAATRDGYDFLGWYTRKDEGEGILVLPETKMGATKNHTLYAHWSKQGETVNSYTVTFNTNPPAGEEAVLSGNQQITVQEGGSYQEMPSAACTGYSFLGWFTAATDGSKIEEGSKADIKADKTLYAHWDKAEPLEYWTAKLNKTVDSLADVEKKTYSSNSAHTDFLKNSGMKKGGDSYDFLIFFGKEEEAVAGDKPTLVIPKQAVEGTEEEQLIYKYKLINYLYGDIGPDTDAAVNELGIDPTELKDIVELAPAEESGDSGDDGGE